MFGSVKAIINLAMAEHGIDGRNPFASVYMPDEIPEECQPIPLDAIRRIQRECMTVDDENRWLLTLISDTGMRLSETTGLARDDIVLDADIPYINLRPHRGDVSRRREVKKAGAIGWGKPMGCQQTARA